MIEYTLNLGGICAYTIGICQYFKDFEFVINYQKFAGRVYFGNFYWVLYRINIFKLIEYGFAQIAGVFLNYH